jgi:hypothetical protein
MLAAGFLVLAAAAAAATAEAPAPVPEDVTTTIEALKARNRDLERRLTDLESKVGESAEMQRLRREEVKALIDQTLAESRQMLAPGWLDNLKFSGDLRLRYEYRDRTDSANRDKRARARLRFGFVKEWPKEDLEVGFRIVSGADEDPTTTNQTFGPMFREQPVGFDRAYARWTPRAVKGLSITAGKMALPWESTNLVWDTDVNPDGAWVEYRVPGLGPVEPFAGAGAFQLYAADNKPDASLKAYGAGVRWQVARDVRYTSAVTFFNFTNIDSAFANVAFFNANPRGNTVVGGKLAAVKFNTIDLVNKVDFVACGLPWTVFVDYVHNNDDEYFTKQNDGLAVGLKAGQNKKKGDWSARYVWKRLEADATLAFFPDSDFGFNTYTNRQGHEWGVDYNLSDAMTVGLTVFYTDPIQAANDAHRFTLMADLVWKF